ncbi:hypothetical protein [Cellulomonas palmilytica]|uniref:hypothetical protein n=1 Tax=Cellulomonas palmilytica TaxID=2608402 RepID=UPI001F3EDBCA|nr:hypothetical protein [Cellulomonas palmilytica]UJP39143.1 hypothetical protein F1D97_12395 [Cellulomonas palmilytica]
MTTATRRAHAPAWVLAFLAAVLAIVLGAFTAGPAPAATTSTAQNAVGASNTAAQVSVETSAGITAGQRLGNDPPQPRTVVATGVAANVAVSKPFAMGIKDHLDDFALTHGADTWKSLPEVGPDAPLGAWKDGVVRKLRDPGQRVLFNLDGVDVWPGVSRAAAGRGGATDWELLQIREGSFPNLEFWQNGKCVGNPFG